MRKKLILGSVISMILLTALFLGWLFWGQGKSHDYSSKWTHSFQMDAGEIKQIGNNAITDKVPTTICQFVIDKEGDYVIHVSNLLQDQTLDTLIKHNTKIGFITGFVIRDESGTPIHSGSGDFFHAEMPQHLTKGLYETTYYYFTREASFLDFAKDYLCGSAFAEGFAGSIHFQDLPSSGKWTMDYTLSINETASFSQRIMIMFYLILMVSAALVLLFTLITKGASVKERYDERQELEKGKAFRYAFFTTLILTLLFLCVESNGIPLPVESSMLYVISSFVGITVFVTYCIWHESYFALNQNKGSLMFLFVLIGLLNLIIGIISILEGTMIQNGIITFHATNLLCAAMFLILFVTMSLKKLSLKKEHSESEEDEEE